MVEAFHQLYTRFHKENYESPDYYRPIGDELLTIARVLIPLDWKTYTQNVWFQVRPKEDIFLPPHGWKIHISATPQNGEEVLRKVIPICVNKKLAFKFLIDKNAIFIMNGKLQSRGSSGKFITIYPLNYQHFLEIIEELHSELKGFEGPHILSDRPYKDSKVVFYRYGGFKGIRQTNVLGERSYKIMSPEGKLIDDPRVPYWNPPYWVTDTLYKEEETPNTELTLKNGRYQIEKAIQLSNTGGVYLALDLQNSNKVIIKEARPGTGTDKYGNDAVEKLKREFRIFKKLHGIGMTPEPIDLFQQWTHTFMVEEYINGDHLGRFMASNTPFGLINLDENSRLGYINIIKKIWGSLAEGIAKIHEMGIVIGDISMSNIIVEDAENGKVRMIDFEGAWEIGKDSPPNVKTPGFSSDKSQEEYGKENDIFALGAIMLGTLLSINNVFDVESSLKNVFIDSLGHDLGIPNSILKLIKQSMSDNPNERPTLLKIKEKVINFEAQDIKTDRYPGNIDAELRNTIKDSLKFIHKSADFQRFDRLYPSDPLVFVTNPLSIAHGAAGVGYALSKLEGEVPKKVNSWILTHSMNPNEYAPGLYVGTSGIAWALWDMGLQEQSLKIMNENYKHPLLWDQADLYYGVSGYGLTSLRLYLLTNDQVWLDRSVEIGDWLLSTKKQDLNGNYYWLSKEGDVWLGYTQGSSGIALYLLYLYLVTGNKKYLEVGELALSHDISYLKTTKEGYLSARRGTIETVTKEKVLTHYWFDGSAGIATSILRYWYVTKNTKYRGILEKLLPDTFRKYTIFPGLFRGLSGLGNVLLDAYDLIGDERYLKEAYKVASGVNLFKIHRPDGIVFPGEQLLRISTDFGTGSAGIALFLNRLVNAKQKLGNFNFMLDEVLDSNAIKNKKEYSFTI